MNAQTTQEMDRHSYLPDHVLAQIISFLPFKAAARTSVLSRRFCHLFETTPVLDLDYKALGITMSDFVTLADRTILRRNPPSSLHRLRFCLRIANTDSWNPLLISFIESLLQKAGSLSLRHLSVNLSSWILAAVLPRILSINSLESLSLEDAYLPPDSTPSTPVNLKHLKSLYIKKTGYLYDDFVNRLVPQLDSLEELDIRTSGTTVLDLKSKTLKKLEMFVFRAIKNLRISTPSLEFFQLKSTFMHPYSIQCDWEMSTLRKAVIQLENVSENNVEVVFKMICTIAHAEELHLDITESQGQLYPFHTLLLHGADPPKFLKLKQLTLDICYHEFNIQDLVTIVQSSPALEVLELIHKPPFRGKKDKKKELWRSMLPQNAEGNHEHFCFGDLHIGEKKEELLTKLTGKQSSKRSKT